MISFEQAFFPVIPDGIRMPTKIQSQTVPFPIRTQALKSPSYLWPFDSSAASKITTNTFMWMPALAGIGGLKPASTNN
jgi:hypothetical protein